MAKSKKATKPKKVRKSKKDTEKPKKVSKKPVKSPKKDTDKPKKVSKKPVKSPKPSKVTEKTKRAPKRTNQLNSTENSQPPAKKSRTVVKKNSKADTKPPKRHNTRSAANRNSFLDLAFQPNYSPPRENLDEFDEFLNSGADNFHDFLEARKSVKFSEATN